MSAVQLYYYSLLTMASSIQQNCMKRVSRFHQSKCRMEHFKVQSCNTCIATSPEISFPGKENLRTWVGIEPTHSIIDELGLMASASSQEPQ